MGYYFRITLGSIFQAALVAALSILFYIFFCQIFSMEYKLSTAIVISTIACFVLSGILLFKQINRIEDSNFTYLDMGWLWKRRIKNRRPKSAKSLRRPLWWHFFACLLCIALFVMFFLQAKKCPIEDESRYQTLLAETIISEVFIFQLIFRWVYLKKIITAVTCEKCQNVFGWEIIEVGNTHVTETVETEYGSASDTWTWKQKTTIEESTPVYCKCAFCGNKKSFYTRSKKVSHSNDSDGSYTSSRKEWDK